MEKSKKILKSAFSYEHGKIQPQAIDVEMAVLGALLIEAKKCDDAMCQLFPAIFYKEEHGKIFTAIKALHDENKQIDIIIVTEKLKATGQLEEVGGAYYIAILSNVATGWYHIDNHVLLLKEKYFARELIRIGSDMVANGYDDCVDVFDQIGAADTMIRNIQDVIASGGNMSHISDVVKKSLEALKHREKMFKHGTASGVETGLTDLNLLTQGWQRGNLIVIAARPGMGKTALMLHFAKSAAKSNYPVCIYSIEMQDMKLSDRMILSEGNVRLGNFRSGDVTDYDWEMVYQSSEVISRLPIYIDDNPFVSMTYIRNHGRMMKKKGQCGMIMIDYLQLADCRTEERNRNREQEISQATRQAKLIAKELDVPVILLSQLSREVEKRMVKKPTLSDLRESGAIEQDADIVAFIYRPEYYGVTTDDNGSSLEGVGQLIIAKNRDGGLKDILFRYNESLTKIYDFDANYTEVEKNAVRVTSGY
jgi:replicative DNA helicase